MLGVEVKVFLMNPNKPVVVVVFDAAACLLVVAAVLAVCGLLIEVVEVAVAEGLMEDG